MREREVPDDVVALAAAIEGRVCASGEDAAALVRGFNAAHLHASPLVVEAASSSDVEVAVAYASRHGLPVAVQATGHGQFLRTDGAVVVLTRRLGSIFIDVARSTATIGAGVRWREVLDAAAVHGLAPLGGSASSVGAVGYLLGGGVGLLARRYGFAADSILSLRIVTADGIERVVDEQSSPELFWAVRGGKSNFGVVTEVTFRLFPVRQVFAASVYFDEDSIASVLASWASWTAEAPEEVTSSFAILRLPDAPFVPPPLRGRTVAHLRWVDCGQPPASSNVDAFTRLRRSGTVLLESGGLRRPADLDFVHDDPVDPCPIWERTRQFSALGDEMVAAIVENAGASADLPLAMVEIRHLGAALAREPEVPNAVAGRGGRYTMLLLGIAPPEQVAEVEQAGGGLLDRLADHLDGRALMNWLGSATSPDQVREAWEPQVVERLLAVKADVDPANIFRCGHPITAELAHHGGDQGGRRHESDDRG